MKMTTGFLERRGRIYYASWNHDGKRYRVSTGEHTRREAEKRLAEYVAPFTAGNKASVLDSIRGRLEGARTAAAVAEDTAHPPLSVHLAWDAYLAASNRPDSGDATLRQYRFQFERFATWMETHHPGAALRDVTEEDAAAYATDLAGAVGPSTFNRHTGLLRLVFRVLAKSARITANPFADINTKIAVQHGRREMTVEELRRVCGKAEGELRTLLAIGLYTGLRLGDCATLRWGEVDLVRGIIRRIPNKTARHNQTPVTVPLHAALAAILAETPEAARRGPVLPDLCERYRCKRDQVTNLVIGHFTACEIACHAPGTGFQFEKDDEGNLIRDDKGHVVLKPTGKRAVMEVGFHSLRHSFVSLCRDAGAPLSVVEAIVGHSSPAMTRHYTHVGEAAATAAVGALPDIIGLAPTPPAPTTDDPVTTLKTKVRELAERLVAGNLKAIRDQLIALCD